MSHTVPTLSVSFKSRRPAPIGIDRPLVEEAGTPRDATLPLIMRPVLDGVNLCHWLERNRQGVDERLHRYGAVLFRGFGLRTQQDLAAAVDALGIEPMHYVEGATPRTQLGGHVYTSTEFPPEHPIALHNELSYVVTWPMRIAFMCVQPAATGGATPIADMRTVLARIPDDIRALFERRGWMLVRNYGDGFGLTWQTAFRASTPDEVEAYCHANRIELEWPDATHLRTRQVRPAITAHPAIGDRVWFNHISFWHVSSLPPEIRRPMLAEYGDYGLPYNTFFGDGEPIPDDIIARIRDAWDAATMSFPWQQGDLLLLDNMLASHGRAAFTGQRRVLVSMGAPYSRMVWQ